MLKLPKERICFKLIYIGTKNTTLGFKQLCCF